MIIHRSSPESRFAIIPHETLRDPRLSYAARGVLAELLSRPDDWETSADAIWRRARRERGSTGEGRDALRAAFAELAACGYLQRLRKRASSGRMFTELHVYDIPAGGTDDGAGGTSVPPGRIGIPAGDTDDGASRRRPGVEEYASSQVAPTPGLPTVGPPVVGPPVVGQPGVSTKTDHEDGFTKIDNEDGGSLSRARRGLAAAGGSEREIDFVIDSARANPRIGGAARYLAATVDRGDAMELLTLARAGRPIGPPPGRQAETDALFDSAMERARARDQLDGAREWCGRCHERTRQIGDPPRRCPDCHWLTGGTANGHPPGQVIPGRVVPAIADGRPEL